MLPSSSLAATLLPLALLASSVLAFDEIRTIPLTRRTQTRQDVVGHARRQADHLLARYRPQIYAQRQRERSLKARRSGPGVTTEALTNFDADVEYFGAIAVGTPSQSYFVLLDTGSADLWLAAPGCSGCTTSTATFSTQQSSSIKLSNTPFQTVYGSGQVQGSLVSDAVTMANYSAAQQVFAVCSAVSAGLLTGPVSGIMGMGFQAISSSNAVPFWQTAGISEFSFALTRYINDTHASDQEPGGFVTLGGTDTDLYTGDINFVSLQSQTYWLIALGGLQVNGVTISGSASNDVAIDTGTTLIGAPPAVVQAAFAQIPGSSALTGNGLQGYWQYPCSANPVISLTFGGVTYTISPADFSQGVVNGNRISLKSQMCMGALFETPQSQDSPNWIVGDTFLKNVYAVFRSSPAAVGFALPSSAVQASQEEASKSPTGSVSVKGAATHPTSLSEWTLLLTIFITLWFTSR